MIFAAFIALACFQGCVSAPANSLQNDKTLMFYGSYKDDFHFRVIAVPNPDGYRVVIMSESGVKLQDMAIKKNGDPEIYFSIDYMPRETAEDFASFFKEFFESGPKRNVKELNGRAYYFNNDAPVLWMKKV